MSSSWTEQPTNAARRQPVIPRKAWFTLTCRVSARQMIRQALVWRQINFEPGEPFAHCHGGPPPTAMESEAAFEATISRDHEVRSVSTAGQNWHPKLTCQTFSPPPKTKPTPIRGLASQSIWNGVADPIESPISLWLATLSVRFRNRQNGSGAG